MRGYDQATLSYKANRNKDAIEWVVAGLDFRPTLANHSRGTCYQVAMSEAAII